MSPSRAVWIKRTSRYLCSIYSSRSKKSRRFGGIWHLLTHLKRGTKMTTLTYNLPQSIRLLRICSIWLIIQQNWGWSRERKSWGPFSDSLSSFFYEIRLKSSLFRNWSSKSKSYNLWMMSRPLLTIGLCKQMRTPILRRRTYQRCINSSCSCGMPTLNGRKLETLRTTSSEVRTTSQSSMRAWKNLSLSRKSHSRCKASKRDTYPSTSYSSRIHPSSCISPWKIKAIRSPKGSSLSNSLFSFSKS